MAVTVRFSNGNVRVFQDATDAFEQGIFLVVTVDSRELHRFDFQDVVEATVAKAIGDKVIKGGASVG